MKTTILLIHGKRAYLCQEEDDKKFIVKKTPQVDGKYCEGINYIINGSVIIRDVDTGTIVGKHSSGNTFTTVSPDKNLQLYFVGDTEWLCITDHTEDSITITHLQADEEITILNKTDLVLVSGEVTCKGKTFNTVTPLRVRTGDIVLKAIQDTTLIIYK